MTQPLEGLPAMPIGPTALPPEVQKGTPDQQKAYRAALSFEHMLLGQLLQSLGTDALGGGDSTSGDDSSGEGAPAAYKELLPNALADSLTASGGIGIAKDLYKSLPTESR